MPGGICFNTVCEIEVTCAVAVRMSTFGWKKILTMPYPINDCDSIWSISLTVELNCRS
ncbi:hypothetical protein GALL_416820 [mine drainage metagenome]|uniref:Uncharacterized protein n=1 Tax=mine drainage metagenome TaxID=410659 RepID=A0A1J5PYR6_9ZZZZ